MGRRQQHRYRTQPAQFPPDFPLRLDEFRRAAGLSWRELARLLQVNVRSVHRWRRGVAPDAGRLLQLLQLAAERDLLHLLLPFVNEYPQPPPCAQASAPVQLRCAARPHRHSDVDGGGSAVARPKCGPAPSGS